MRREYRQIIENIELTKEEALILDKARELCENALTLLHESPDERDEDLEEALVEGLNGLENCNARLNVNTILEKD